MGDLKLYGMKAAFDEIMTTAVKRQHEPQGIVGDLLNGEISEKQARSIKYQLTIAKLPLAKDLDDFQFHAKPRCFKRLSLAGQKKPDMYWSAPRAAEGQ
jgi:IstB-like ATP binding protein